MLYLRLYGVGEISNRAEKEMLYLTTHSTHFIYGYMASEEISNRAEKEMLYLTMHSTHFIYGYMASEKFQIEQRRKCFI